MPLRGPEKRVLRAPLAALRATLAVTITPVTFTSLSQVARSLPRAQKGHFLSRRASRGGSVGRSEQTESETQKNRREGRSDTPILLINPHCCSTLGPLVLYSAS
eukprot:scaffold739_cov105-Phaeocystis_antarctica.AAC.3